MGGKGSGKLSQIFSVKRAAEVLSLSEAKLIQVLKGETSLKEVEVVKVALELYKRRVPNKVENPDAPVGNITMIKVVKNHLPPDYRSNGIEEAAEEFLEAQSEVEEANRIQNNRMD